MRSCGVQGGKDIYDGKELKNHKIVDFCSGKNQNKLSKLYSKTCIYANSGISILDRVQKVANLKKDSDLFKINNGFPEGYDSVIGERVNFSNNF